MMQATITPSFIDPPKPGKRNWSVKDKENVRWSVPPAIAEKMQKGQSVVVDYEVNDYQGRSYNLVKAIAGELESRVASYAMGGPAKAAPQANGNGKSAEQEASMFAMSFVGRLYAGTATFPGQVVLAQDIRTARQAWLDSMRSTPSPQNPQAPDNSDDPPY